MKPKDFTKMRVLIRRITPTLPLLVEYTQHCVLRTHLIWEFSSESEL